MKIPLLALACMTLLPACAHVTVDPIEVKPIYITMDVNIKVDRQLDNFFSFEDKYPSPATQPTTAATQPTASTSENSGL